MGNNRVTEKGEKGVHEWMQHRGSRPLAERFAEKVDVRGATECWPWRASVNGKGYGTIGSGDKRVLLAHRVAYEAAIGPIPAGMCVCHDCGDRRCCNPSHLRLGTNAETMADTVAKGRQCSGEKNASAKLTEETVREIRILCAGGMTQAAAARQFGINHSTVNAIVRRKSWQHVPDVRDASV